MKRKTPNKSTQHPRPGLSVRQWVLLASIALALVAGIIWLARLPAPAPAPADITVKTNVDLGGPFTLTRQDGQRVGPQDFSQPLLLIYFGYTFCPDICPLELHNVSSALEQLGPQAEKIAPIFITVDPQRDTVAVMSDYVDLFPVEITGLTGTEAEVKDVMKLFRIYSNRTQGDDSSDYVVDHSTFLYVTDTNGRVLTLLKGGASPENIAAQLQRLLK